MPFIWFFTAAVVFMGVTDPNNAAVYIFGLVLSPFYLFWLSSRTVIHDGHLEQGNRFRPQRLPLSEIRSVRRGKVGWGQALVDGLVIDRRDGREYRLIHSPHLTSERQREWIATIKKATADLNDDDAEFD